MSDWDGIMDKLTPEQKEAVVRMAEDIKKELEILVSAYRLTDREQLFADAVGKRLDAGYEIDVTTGQPC